MRLKLVLAVLRPVRFLVGIFSSIGQSLTTPVLPIFFVTSVNRFVVRYMIRHFFFHLRARLVLFKTRSPLDLHKH